MCVCVCVCVCVCACVLRAQVELNVRKRELDSQMRHLTDQTGLGAKDYDLLKRQLRKKRINCESAKQLLPGLETQLADHEMHLRLVQDDRSQRNKQNSKLRAEVGRPDLT